MELVLQLVRCVYTTLASINVRVRVGFVGRYSINIINIIIINIIMANFVRVLPCITHKLASIAQSRYFLLKRTTTSSTYLSFSLFTICQLFTGLTPREWDG